MDAAPDPDLAAFALDAGLVRVSEAPVWTALNAGVSSEIWRLDAGPRSYCLKRPLAKLRTAADWRAPVARFLYEWRWFELAGRLVPGAAPPLVALDEARGCFAMAFLPPDDYPLWKPQLMAGRAEPASAAAVGARLAAVHAATASAPDIAAQFPTDSIFHALRIDAYLLAAARNRPEVSAELEALARRTAATRLALVHGDASPKNILIGPDGPVFLDAETAWWGDPAFDAAFCLNHLMLKQLAVPRARAGLEACFAAFTEAYLPTVDWEPQADFEARAASLLPGLMLARVDGKSPVEYITAAADRDLIRGFAIRFLRTPPERLSELACAWTAALGG